MSPEGFDPTSISIEHILPQNPKKWNLTKTQIRPYVNTIGNLTLIHPDMNGVMGNKTLEEKIPVLHESTVRLNEELLDMIEYKQVEREIESENDDAPMIELVDIPIWNQDSIEKRTNDLLEKSLKIWSI